MCPMPEKKEQKQHLFVFLNFFAKSNEPPKHPAYALFVFWKLQTFVENDTSFHKVNQITVHQAYLVLAHAFVWCTLGKSNPINALVSKHAPNCLCPVSQTKCDPI